MWGWGVVCAEGKEGQDKSCRTVTPAQSRGAWLDPLSAMDGVNHCQQLLYTTRHCTAKATFTCLSL